jgi:hypothetical protein
MGLAAVRFFLTLMLALSIGVVPAWAECYFLECDDTTVATAPIEPQAPQPPQPPPSQGPERTYWNHNGSIMYLVVNGNQREFYYSQPRQGMIDEGVTPGTLLFTGTVNGNYYTGTAYLFSARCGKRGYQVSGPVQETGGRVVMSGAALVLNKRCEPRKVINDVLVFNYLYKG